VPSNAPLVPVLSLLKLVQKGPGIPASASIMVFGHHRS
jgi:hypothetical protein